MQTERKNKKTAVFTAMLLAVSLLLSGLAAPEARAVQPGGEKAEDPIEFSVPMTLLLSGEGAGEQDMTFRFRMTADTSDAPMPGGDGNIVELSGAGEGVFGPVSVQVTGTYDYTIRQITEERAEWTLDETVYHAHVFVYLNDEEKLVASVTLEKEGQEEKPKEVRFENSYERELTSVNGSKTWDDADDQDGVRPESITVRLRADGRVVDTKTVTAADDWKWAFVRLPKYEKGTAVTYTVTEDAVTGYSTEVSRYNVKNTRTPDETSVTVSKVWEDDNDRDGVRPAAVTVTLLADGREAGIPDAAAELNEGNNWTYTWKNLPLNAAGKAVVYTVREDQTPGYRTAVSGDQTEGYTVTNSHTPEKTEVNGRKTWVDNNDQDGVRPETITIRLRANGKIVKTRRISEKNGWEWSFKDLPKYENGREIEYTITEDRVKEYSTEVNGYDVTNTHTPGETSLTVLKIWNDGDNMEGNRPKNIKVTLYADGEKAAVKNATVTLNRKNNWSYTWSGLPEKKDGQQLVYTVMEPPLEGYITEYAGDAVTGIVITNSFPPQLRAVSGTKTWDDDDDRDGMRPESIIVRLLADGVEIDSQVVSEETGWSWVFTGLPGYKNGERIRYTIKEDVVPGYSAKVKYFDVTNRRTPGETTVTVNKVWDDDNDRDGIRPNAVTVTLYADGKEAAAADAAVVLNGENGWSYTWENLPAKANGKDISYTVRETETEGYVSVITGDQKKGYTVTNTHTPETMDLSGVKTWADNGDADGVRPKSITIRVLADGKEAASKTVTAADGWAWTFTGLPLAKDGKEITYTVTEDPVPGYTAKVEGYNVVNTHSPNPKTSDGGDGIKYLWIGAGSLAAACLLFAGYRISRKKKR